MSTDIELTTDLPHNRLWPRSVLGIVLALGGISLPFGSWVDASKDILHGVGCELIYWSLAAVMLLYVRLVERRPLSSIGLRAPHALDLLLAVGTGLVIIAVLAAVYMVIFPALHWTEAEQLAEVTSSPPWLTSLIVLRAAVSEEILFRGYALERLQTLSGSPLAAGLISCVVFTLDHISFWGWHHVVVAGSAGAILTLFYLWRRNLWACMLAHFIVDAIGLLA